MHRDLIPHIYEGVGGQQWPSPGLMAKYGDALAASAVNLVAIDHAARSARIEVSLGVDDDWRSAYRNFYGRNVWIPSGPAPLAGTVLDSTTIISEGDFVKSEYYNDFLRPQGAFYACGAVLTDEGSRYHAITAWRPKSEGAFGEEHFELIRRLMPHFQRAFQLHQFARAAGYRPVDYGRLADKVTHHPPPEVRLGGAEFPQPRCHAPLPD